MIGHRGVAPRQFDGDRLPCSGQPLLPRGTLGPNPRPGLPGRPPCLLRRRLIRHLRSHPSSKRRSTSHRQYPGPSRFQRSSSDLATRRRRAPTSPPIPAPLNSHTPLASTGISTRVAPGLTASPPALFGPRSPVRRNLSRCLEPCSAARAGPVCGPRPPPIAAFGKRDGLHPQADRRVGV
ncbi:hypothetical protein [Ornithinimicrobium kibberense]|uniref:hypothetical protein n=1 Tax=Ornithinimicrobium kibberense TaxID=282060 RepID=UPI003623FC3B